MSREWIRSAVSTRCGRCNELINKGDPVLLIVVVRGSRVLRFLRCGDCEGPAPPSLPPFVERTPIVPLPTRVGSLLPFGREPRGARVDWKERAAGAEREPGEEG